MQIMVSVLRNAASKALLSRLKDFDEYSYDFYVCRPFASRMDTMEIRDPTLATVETEVVGGYLAYLRKVPNAINGKGYWVDYRLDLVDQISRCKLDGQVILFGGTNSGRQTVHFVGDKSNLLNTLSKIVENEDRRGFVSDVADCIDLLTM